METKYGVPSFKEEPNNYTVMSILRCTDLHSLRTQVSIATQIVSAILCRLMVGTSVPEWYKCGLETHSRKKRKVLIPSNTSYATGAMTSICYAVEPGLFVYGNEMRYLGHLYHTMRLRIIRGDQSSE